MQPQETPTQNPGIVIDRKSKILFIVIALFIAGAVAATYWRIVVKRDYIVQAQTECDPSAENCFIWQCDPESDVEGEACTGDPEEDIWYYKIVNRNAKNIPLCDPNDEECDALTCGDNEADCSEELCTIENVPEGEQCNDPVQYNIDNPPEEDDEECAPDDEECLNEQEAVECEEGDQECLSTQDEAVQCEEGDEECAAEEDATECAPDDQECLQAEEESDETEPGKDTGNPVDDSGNKTESQQLPILPM